MISIRPARVEDAKLELRAHEQFIFGTMGFDSEKEIAESIEKANFAWTAFVDDAPACIWGIQQDNLMGGVHLWMITTPLVDKNCRAFLKLSREVTSACADRFGTLFGYVDINFKKSLKWMEWLGFHPVFDIPLDNLVIRKFERHGN